MPEQIEVRAGTTYGASYLLVTRDDGSQYKVLRNDPEFEARLMELNRARVASGDQSPLPRDIAERLSFYQQTPPSMVPASSTEPVPSDLTGPIVSPLDPRRPADEASKMTLAQSLALQVAKAGAPKRSRSGVGSAVGVAGGATASGVAVPKVPEVGAMGAAPSAGGMRGPGGNPMTTGMGGPPSERSPGIDLKLTTSGVSTGAFPNWMPRSGRSESYSRALYQMTPGELDRLQMRMWNAGFYGPQAVSSRTLPQRGVVDEETSAAFQLLLNTAASYKQGDKGVEKGLEDLLDERAKAMRPYHDAFNASMANEYAVDIPDVTVTLTDRATVEEHLRAYSRQEIGREVDDASIAAMTDQVLAEEERILVGQARAERARLTAQAQADVAAATGGPDVFTSSEPDVLWGGGPDSTAMGHLADLAAAFGVTIELGYSPNGSGDEYISNYAMWFGPDIKEYDAFQYDESGQIMRGPDPDGDGPRVGEPILERNEKGELVHQPDPNTKDGTGRLRTVRATVHSVDDAFADGRAARFNGSEENLKRLDAYLKRNEGVGKTYGYTQRTANGLYVAVNEGGKRPAEFPKNGRLTEEQRRSAFFNALRDDSTGRFNLPSRVRVAAGYSLGMNKDAALNDANEEELASNYFGALYNRYQGDLRKVAVAWNTSPEYADRYVPGQAIAKGKAYGGWGKGIGAAYQAVLDKRVNTTMERFGALATGQPPPVQDGGWSALLGGSPAAPSVQGGNVYTEQNVDAGARAEQQFNETHAIARTGYNAMATWEQAMEAIAPGAV